MTDAIGNNAVQQLRSVYDRWLRLEEDKAALGEDLKELFAEARGNGFDAKALRVAFRKRRALSDDAGKVLEHDAIVDTYMAALTGTNHATHARGARELPAPPDIEAHEALSESVDPVAGARGEESAGTVPPDEPEIPAFLRRRPA